MSRWRRDSATERVAVRSDIKRVAFVGDYVPRQCGIATFTADICEAVAGAPDGIETFAVPMNDREAGYPYGPRVRFEVYDRDIAGYRRAADFLNSNNVDIVCVQHEFGIYGGPAGSHLLALLRDLRMPIVTTLHTVLKEPDKAQRRVMDELAKLSDRLIVMSQTGLGFCQDIYGIPADQIDFIHHGIPDVPFVDPNFYKDKFDVAGNRVLLTFGLLSPNKGIETVIRALPSIVKHHPDVVYMVLGATHPHLVRQEGEAYRLRLQRLATDLDVDEHVVFHNRFVDLEELIEFVGAADLYVTPYHNMAQITSGTLAYAVGMGKAVLSTPYWYAEELLADGRGLLFPLNDHQKLAEQVVFLLDNETERHSMRKKAYALGREMIWPEVANRYIDSFERAIAGRHLKPRQTFFKALTQHRRELPSLNLDHLMRMTDDTGLVQHAKYSAPDYREGYSIDDNARGLILATYLEELGGAASKTALDLATRYLAFIHYAFNDDVGRFRNFMSFDRRWLEEVGSPDSHARTLWALGVVVGRSESRNLRGLANHLFLKGLPAALELDSPRSWAFSLLGIMEYLRRFYGHRAAHGARVELAERLLTLHQENATAEWPWFEDTLTYANARLPHALITCGRWLERPDMLDTGIQALHWLIDVQRMNGDHVVPIGSRGWYRKGGERARFDQQPIELHATVSACLETFHITGEAYWRREAQRAFDWFLGRNDLNQSVYNPETGGCHDGLTPDNVNANQGAESTLSFLLSLMEMRQAMHIIAAQSEEAADRAKEELDSESALASAKRSN